MILAEYHARCHDDGARAIYGRNARAAARFISRYFIAISGRR